MIKLKLNFINCYLMQKNINFAYENVYIYDAGYSSSAFRTFTKL